MGRLIDTDVLENFIKTHSCSVGTDGVLLTVGEDKRWHNLLEYIPTAQDVDKVVEQLEKLRSKDVCDYLDCDVCLYKDKCGAETDQSNNLKWDKGIEIVKQGGVSDDVCEWKTASDGEFIQNPHTKRLYSNESSMKNIYCNTCGKKIKVVDNGKQCSNRNSKDGEKMFKVIDMRGNVHIAYGTFIDEDGDI